MKSQPYYEAEVIGGCHSEQSITLKVSTLEFEKFPMGSKVKFVLVDERNVPKKEMNK